jgi:hypothetical protein
LSSKPAPTPAPAPVPAKGLYPQIDPEEVLGPASDSQRSSLLDAWLYPSMTPDDVLSLTAERTRQGRGFAPGSFLANTRQLPNGRFDDDAANLYRCAAENVDVGRLLDALLRTMCRGEVTKLAALTRECARVMDVSPMPPDLPPERLQASTLCREVGPHRRGPRRTVVPGRTVAGTLCARGEAGNKRAQS